MNAHAKKMSNIGKSYQVIQEARVVTKQLQRNRDERKKTKDFLTNEKNLTINKDNQILLNKLVEISSGKWSSVAPAPKKRMNRSVQPQQLKGPTSLNMGMRKRETERIEKENHAFAKRLFDKKAVLKKKDLDHDWASHLVYKRQIAKMSMPPSKGSIFKNRGATAGGYSMSNIPQGQPIMEQQMEHVQ